MDLIAKQAYIKVLREIDGLEQIDMEHKRFLCLYADRIVTRYREFPIQEVLDISHREIAGEGGLLYLHTMSGVYSYIVKVSPQSFIEAFREHRGK